MNYKIPVVWMMLGSVDVEANSLEEAVEIALNEEIPEGDYLEGSYMIDPGSVEDNLSKRSQQ